MYPRRKSFAKYCLLEQHAVMQRDLVRTPLAPALFAVDQIAALSLKFKLLLFFTKNFIIGFFKKTKQYDWNQMKTSFVY